MSEKIQRPRTEIISPETEGLTDLVVKVISRGGVVIMKIDGPMYGFVINAADQGVVERVWQIKGRVWKPKPVDVGEGAPKPVTAVTRERFFDFVDWQTLGWGPDDTKVKTFLDSRVHLIFPVRPDMVPSHLITLHGQIPTLSMMVVDKNFPLLGPVVVALEKTNPDIIVGGSSANMSGNPVFTQIGPLIEQLGGKVDVIIQGEDIVHNERAGRITHQRGMVLALPNKIKIVREGIGIDQLKDGLTVFSDAP